jgi:hypothetical protein
MTTKGRPEGHIEDVYTINSSNWEWLCSCGWRGTQLYEHWEEVGNKTKVKSMILTDSSFRSLTERVEGILEGLIKRGDKIIAVTNVANSAFSSTSYWAAIYHQTESA